ncbi:MAG: hypothetical protein LBL34_02975 [Clostridiales bacterium]|nr:hypothetical protein [Clostridiales bacterium]
MAANNAEQMLDFPEQLSAYNAPRDIKDIQEVLFGRGSLFFSYGIQRLQNRMNLTYLLKYAEGEKIPEYKLKNVQKIAEKFGGVFTGDFQTDKESNFGGMQPSLHSFKEAYDIIMEKASRHIQQYSEEHAISHRFTRAQFSLRKQLQARILIGAADIMGGEFGRAFADGEVKLSATKKEKALAKLFIAMINIMFINLDDTPDFDQRYLLTFEMLDYIAACGVDVYNGKNEYSLSIAEKKEILLNLMVDEKNKNLFPNSEQLDKINTLMKTEKTEHDDYASLVGNADEVFKKCYDVGMTKREASETYMFGLRRDDECSLSTFLKNGNTDAPVVFIHLTPLSRAGRTHINISGVHEILHAFEAQFYESDSGKLRKSGFETGIETKDYTYVERDLTNNEPMQHKNPRKYEMLSEVIHQHYTYRVVDELEKRSVRLVESPFTEMSKGSASYDRALDLVDPFIKKCGQQLSDALVDKDSFDKFERIVGEEFLIKYDKLIFEYVHGCGFRDKEKAQEIETKIADLLKSNKNLDNIQKTSIRELKSSPNTPERPDSVTKSFTVLK